MLGSGRDFDIKAKGRKDLAQKALRADDEKEDIAGASASVRAFRDQITKDAQQEVERILGKAKLAVARRIEEAEKEAECIARHIREAAQAQAREIQARTMSGISLEMKKIALTAQGQIIEEVFATVRERLKDLRGSKRYSDFLKELALQGIMALGGEECILAPAAEDRDLFTPQLIEDIQRSVERRAGRKVKLTTSHDLSPEGFGVRVYSGARTMLFDNTLDARTQRLAEELKAAVAREVFAPDRAIAKDQEGAETEGV